MGVLELSGDGLIQDGVATGLEDDEEGGNAGALFVAEVDAPLYGTPVGDAS